MASLQSRPTPDSGMLFGPRDPTAAPTKINEVLLVESSADMNGKRLELNFIRVHVQLEVVSETLEIFFGFFDVGGIEW